MAENNTYADAAREKKVRALIRYFDQRFILVGRCPYREAGELAEMLRDSVSEDQWKHHALQAGVNAPSPTSVALVINEYEDRAAARAASPVRQYGGTH
jgi:hypothetical protein